MSVFTNNLGFVMYSKLFKSVLYILGQEKDFIEKSVYCLLLKRLLYIPITSVCQKRKPQIDGSLLNVLHL